MSGLTRLARPRRHASRSRTRSSINYINKSLQQECTSCQIKAEMAQYIKPYDPNDGGAVKSGHVRVVLIVAEPGDAREVNRRDVAIKSGATIGSLNNLDVEIFDSDYTQPYFFEEATQVRWQYSATALEYETPLSKFDGRTIFMPYLSK